jgi:hypothetical protein
MQGKNKLLSFSLLGMISAKNSGINKELQY